jgi:hypothetical protein
MAMIWMGSAGLADDWSGWNEVENSDSGSILFRSKMPENTTPGTWQLKSTYPGWVKVEYDVTYTYESGRTQTHQDNRLLKTDRPANLDYGFWKMEPSVRITRVVMNP